MVLRSSDPDQLWVDYTITSASSGKTYRLALRGWERGDSYCSCPDFRTNTLGACKHIMHALAKVRKRFPARIRNAAHVQPEIAVHIRYGSGLELRVLVPDGLPRDICEILAPFSDVAVENVHSLLRAIRKVEADGRDVLIHPDAEEHMNRRLFAERVATKSLFGMSEPSGQPSVPPGATCPEPETSEGKKT